MNETTNLEKYDAIVIGSGIGGLTTAAILAKLNCQKVLVLEQHFTPGGFTHAFERKGKFHWDVGLHYVGEMGKGEISQAIFDYISNGKLEWQKMPELMEKFVYPDFTFDVYADPKKYQADLIKEFPQEGANIKRYFRDIHIGATWFLANGFIEVFPQWLQPLVKTIFKRFGKIARQTTEEYLDRNFQDRRLKAVLASQWGDHGLTPALSSFGAHCNIVTHFLNGGWYPIGGGKAIAQTVIPTIEQSGGKVITQRRVTEIIIEAGVAVGVKVQHTGKGTEELYHAPLIISDAGAYNTYQKLIPLSYPIAYRESIEQFTAGTNVSTVYLGLKENPQKLGFHGENHWIYETYDHEYNGESKPIDADYLPGMVYMSFPSLKNPLAIGHTAELISDTKYEVVAPWEEQRWRKRDSNYAAFKAQVAKSSIDFVERHYPGFRDTIEYIEVSTPLTVAHFGSSHRGAIYGIPSTPARLDCPWIASKTPIKNLYLTGTDAFSLGIIGAMIGGVKTAGLVNGLVGFMRVMTTIFNPLK